MDNILISIMAASSHRREGFTGQRLFILPASLQLEARRHALLKGLFLTAAGFFPEAPGHLVRRPKGLPEIVLILCLSGRGWIQCEKSPRREVRAGEAIIIPAGVGHSYGADEKIPWSISWAHFRGRLLTEFAKFLGTTPADPIIKLLPETLERLRFEELYVEMEADCTFTNLLGTSARLRMILIDLVRNRASTSLRADVVPQALKVNIEWMRTHRDQKLGLADLAGQTGFSIPHYSERFKQWTGSSPMKYFQRLKIQQAAQLLILTNRSVQEIALSVGLDDPFYFSRLFKKIMGHGPRAFRDNYCQ